MKSIPNLKILAVILAGSSVAFAIGRVDEKKVEKQLEARATYVVVGIVKDMKVTRATGRGEERLEAITATLQVSTVEKGKGIKVGQALQIRFHRRRGPNTKLFPDVPDYDPVPSEGIEVRAYLDKSMRVLTTNGFVLHPNSPNRKVVKADNAVATLDAQAKEKLLRQRLTRTSSHGLIAKVVSVQESDLRGSNVKGSSSLRHTNLTAKVEVLKVVKGVGIKVGDRIDVQYFKQEFGDSKSPAHRLVKYSRLPEVGDTVEVFLIKRGTGEYIVSLPDGFLKITKPKKKSPEVESKEPRKGQ